MTKKEYAKKIENLYIEMFERTISKDKTRHPQYGDYTNCALITLVCNDIERYIRRRNPRLKELSDYQQEQLDIALVYQIHAVLSDIDYNDVSGYDVTTNTAIAKSEIDKRKVCSRTKDTLSAAGLLYPASQVGGFVPPWRW